jgi:hypothetical protein
MVDNPTIPPELIRQVDLDRTTFVSNARLKDVMTGTSATPEQISEAVIKQEVGRSWAALAVVVTAAGEGAAAEGVVAVGMTAFPSLSSRIDSNTTGARDSAGPNTVLRQR